VVNGSLVSCHVAAIITFLAARQRITTEKSRLVRANDAQCQPCYLVRLVNTECTAFAT
jgi:hypothetical protein